MFGMFVTPCSTPKPRTPMVIKMHGCFSSSGRGGVFKQALVLLLSRLRCCCQDCTCGWPRPTRMYELLVYFGIFALHPQVLVVMVVGALEHYSTCVYNIVIVPRVSSSHTISESHIIAMTAMTAVACMDRQAPIAAIRGCDG